MFITILCFLCLVFARVLAGPPESVNEAEGMLKLSDGSEYKGKIYLTGKKPLVLYQKGDRKRKTFPFEQIAWFEFDVLKAGSKKKFKFKESGKDEKIESEDKVPRLDIAITVHLKSGKSVTGTVQPATIYVESNDEREKFKLLKLVHGETNESVDSLVYVREVRFAGAEEPAVTYKITGEVAPPEQLVSAAAWHRDTMTMYKGEAAAGKYEIEVPQSGAYDVVLTFSYEVRLWLGAAKDGSDGPEPDTEFVSNIQGVIDGMGHDFFDSVRAVKVVGEKDWAVVLVDMYRKKETHYSKENPDARFRRVEIWMFRKSNLRWRREFKSPPLYRERLDSKEEAHRRLALDKALGGVVLSKESPTAKRDLELTDSSLEKPGELPEAPPGNPTDPEPEKENDKTRKK
jgi:hypothetical protein